ncbi:hypothetical protein [Marinifilum caeruleilacunae]|uniref:Uncharacterized protein n=1 Tax=Marinifilum caeruleilacunae TaxID=2499076 RepID=A0ABX1WUM4_9BACT|nr:hypothetical protein [Marinifilum caeruleilacunae]NOU59707.1 hypothetical protein [Marinifilum caeruleilacunae]
MKKLEAIKINVSKIDKDICYAKTNYWFGSICEYEFEIEDEVPNDEMRDLDITCEIIKETPALILLFSRYLIVNEGYESERQFLIFNHKSLVVLELIIKEDEVVDCSEIDLSNLNLAERNEEKKMTSFIKCLIGRDIKNNNTYGLYANPIWLGNGYQDNCWSNEGCKVSGCNDGNCSWLTFKCDCTE